MLLEYTLTMFSRSRILKSLFPLFRGHGSFFTVFIRTYCWILPEPDESSPYPHTLFRNLTAAIDTMIVVIRSDKCCDTLTVNMTLISYNHAAANDCYTVVIK